MHCSTAFNTSPLSRYYTCTSLLITEVPGQKESMKRGLLFFYLLGSMALSIEFFSGEVLASFSGLAFVTSLISIINLRLDAPPQKFLHATEWGPAKVFQIGPCTF